MKARTAYLLLALLALTGIRASETSSKLAQGIEPSLKGMPASITTTIVGYLLPANSSMEDAVIRLCRDGLSVNAIQLIMERNPDIPTHGEAMLEAACRAGLYSVAELLTERGATITPRVAVSAAAGGNVALLKMLDPECTQFREHLGEMLYYADQNSHFHMVRHLLDNGAPILACRMRTLMAAAEKGDLKQVKCLTEHGANEGPLLGKALSAAVRGGYRDIVNYFLDNGANVNA